MVQRHAAFGIVACCGWFPNEPGCLLDVFCFFRWKLATAGRRSSIPRIRSYEFFQAANRTLQRQRASTVDGNRQRSRPLVGLGRRYTAQIRMWCETVESLNVCMYSTHIRTATLAIGRSVGRHACMEVHGMALHGMEVVPIRISKSRRPRRHRDGWPLRCGDWW